MARNFVLHLFLTASLLSVYHNSSSAQDTTANKAPLVVKMPAKIADPSLNGQYRDMLMRSRTQEGYKLINPYRLTTLWNNTLDSLNTEKRKRIEAEQKLSRGIKSINSIKDSLSQNQATLDQSKTLVNQISLFGIPIDKSVYNYVMGGVVIVLILALLILLFQSSRYRKEAVYRVKLFEELSGEFQTYKIKANEREKKLARELQDERNKLDDLTNRDH